MEEEGSRGEEKRGEEKMKGREGKGKQKGTPVIMPEGGRRERGSCRRTQCLPVNSRSSYGHTYLSLGGFYMIARLSVP